MSLRALLPIAALAFAACQEYPDVTLTPAQKKKVQAHVLAEKPTPQHTIGAVIEDQVQLIGYDLDKSEVKPGETFTITYYIESLADPKADNRMFVHLQGRPNDRNAWMNLDHSPIDGLLPLRDLKKGQIVRDVHRITVKSDFTPGDAHVYWGLFRGDNRLKIANPDKIKHDGDNRVVIAKVKIKGEPSKPKKLPTALARRVAVDTSIVVDGKLDDTGWAKSAWTQYWTDPRGQKGEVPKTRARFAWDDTFLYVGVESVDTDVWSTFKDRDSNTWEQEVIELFIDADGDRKDYLELQVTPANVVFDARFETHRSDLAKARAWNMEGLDTAVHVDGTLNARDDVDRGYTVEMAIPIARVPGAPTPPRAGQSWRVNLFRWDQPKEKRQIASAFSPPIAPDFHALDRFGHLRFVGAIGTGAALPTHLGPEALRLDAKKIRPNLKGKLDKADLKNALERVPFSAQGPTKIGPMATPKPIAAPPAPEAAPAAPPVPKTP